MISIHYLIQNIVELLKENNYFNISIEINYKTLTINLINEKKNHKIPILYNIGSECCLVDFTVSDHFIRLNKEDISCIFRIMNYIDNSKEEIDEMCYGLCSNHREFKYAKKSNNKI